MDSPNKQQSPWSDPNPAAVAETAEAMIGTVISGKYRLLRLLGEGGMGAVYEAEHCLLRHRVAIKMMHRSLVSSDEAFQRFLREAQTCGAINHPNIVAAHDFGVDDSDNIFIIMELLRGEPLVDLLERRGSLPVDRAVAIALQILSGLHVAHAAGVVHRDLKPDNIFLAVDPRGREEVKILDFGVAKVQATAEGDMSLTRTGAVIGTPCYLSPEQARARKNVDGRADLWSVGVILYEMLSGESPFEGSSYNETYSRILLEDPPRLSDFAPHVSAAVSKVVEGALVKEPQQRYSSAAQMMDALAQAVPCDESTMSSGALHALRRTSSMSAPAPREAMLTPVTPTEDRARFKSLPTVMETIASDVSQLRVPRTRGRARMVLSGAVAFGGVLFVGLLLWTRVEPKVEVEPASMSRSSAPSDEPAAEPLVAEKPASPPLSRSVELSVAGLPEDATVKLDDATIEVPILLPADGEPHILRVLAAGYKPFKAAIVLDSNQVINYHAVPKAHKRRLPRSKSGKPKRLLLDNPF